MAQRGHLPTSRRPLFSPRPPRSESTHDRTLRPDRRRSPPPDRAEAPRALRTAGKLHRPHRGDRPRGERHPRARFRPRPRHRQAADAAVARGEDLPALHGLPIGIKDLEDTAGLRTTYGSVDLPRPRPGGRRTHRRRGARRRRRSSSARPTRRSSAPAPTRATPSTAPPATRSTRRNPPPDRRAARRWRWRPAWRRSAPAPTPAARCATRPRSAASSASARRPAWCPATSAASAGATCPCSARWPAPFPTPACCSPPSPATMRAIRSPPLCTAARVHRPEDFARPAPIDLSRLRVALTPDFGFAPTERHIAEMFAESTALFRHVFARAEDATPDCAGADEAFEVLRALAFLAAPSRQGAHPAAGRRPQRARQCRGRPALHRRRRGARAGVADRAVSPLAGVLPGLRRDPDAVDHHQPALLARAVSRPRSTASRPGPISTGWRWPMR